MKNSKNNKVIMIVVASILVVNIILMLYLVYKYRNKHIKYTAPTVQYVNSEKLSFENVQEILSVTLKTKELSSAQILSSIQEFSIEFLSNINESLLQSDDNNVEMFYTQNKEYIKQYSGIDSKEKFEILYSNLKKVDCNLGGISRVQFMNDTAKYNDGIFKVQAKVIDYEGKFMNINISIYVGEKNTFEYTIQI